jgi:AraC-like DNA-binding protein
MSHSIVVPMTGAAAIGPLPSLITEQAGERAVDRAFRSAGLTLSAIDNPRTPIPLRGLAQLWESGARFGGDRCFGYAGGLDMTHTTYGLWLAFCVSAPTLSAALARMPVSIGFHQVGTRFSVDQEGGVAVLRYHPAWPGQFPHHSDHVVGSAVRLVRNYLGTDWRPRWVEVDYQRDADWRRLEEAIGAEIRFGAGRTGVAVSRADLSRVRPTAIERILTLDDVAVEAAVIPRPEPLRSVLNVVGYRLLEGETDIDGAAALCGVGVQSLQRRLRQAGLSYREVLACARRRRAEALLRDTTIPIAEIAYALGYQDHASFTHAFNRWTGRAPSAFRASPGPGHPGGSGNR